MAIPCGVESQRVMLPPCAVDPNRPSLECPLNGSLGSGSSISKFLKGGGIERTTALMIPAGDDAPGIVLPCQVG